MGLFNYQGIYQLQDTILEIVFAEPSGLYLTGGTALSRFYLQHRYSDDLDFFYSDPAQFPDVFRTIYRTLVKRYPSLQIPVDARDFKRVIITEGSYSLKLDFVADRIPRIGIPVYSGPIRIDTVRNILSNKICALLNRDEPKDVADILWIAMKRQFNWSDIIADAQKKDIFLLEDILLRLKTFPITLLETVPFIIEKPLAVYKDALECVYTDIALQTDNSLGKTVNAAILE
ncbi:nucleotidyl transferase AbiEii/AbiGii toxin family protein [Treponema sp. J25]|jgi:predicted nucleotidyltransferase component of viral defense system|uniref:nucleotidyl transferase AbiEii/AbiGii toxin family protein n=1 Tax=Treponema sp. J25 TaxID=2094121 RepID=UPI00104CF7C4|nr:nucleotidyl transferase AbiEii/AbiGii toxin family protein [Treponema sp. J25]TCW60806.1 hypothetical protein C5O22_09120 [Treponema sp. J25]